MTFGFEHSRFEPWHRRYWNLVIIHSFLSLIPCNCCLKSKIFYRFAGLRQIVLTEVDFWRQEENICCECRPHCERGYLRSNKHENTQVTNGQCRPSCSQMQRLIIWLEAAIDVSVPPTLLVKTNKKHLSLLLSLRNRMNWVVILTSKVTPKQELITSQALPSCERYWSSRPYSIHLVASHFGLTVCYSLKVPLTIVYHFS